ncbi:hypothetical protein SteCoe_27064 [Stentor coeruleus]|uniref:Uncharacterized protein n=1 Tax=Stentor coeruleus TaxID=5963 RepID=A0A1R2BBA6_9CILI|nr:hypothetical protein SteCoe_27064 [Stentor coeruleus]
MGLCSSSQAEPIFSMLKDIQEIKSAISQLEDLKQDLKSKYSNLQTIYSKQSGRDLRRTKIVVVETHHTITEFTKVKRVNYHYIVKKISKYYKKAESKDIRNAFNRFKNIKKIKFIQNVELSIEKEEESKENFEAVEKVKKESSRVMEMNVLAKISSSGKEKYDLNMPIVHLVHMFEDFIFVKYLEDIRAIERKEEPVSMPEFFIEYLFKRNGTLSKVKKILNQTALNFERHQEKSILLQVFSSLLQFKTHDPISRHLALFLTRIMLEFDKVKIRPKIFTFESTGKKQKNALEGGYAYLRNIFPLLFKFFPSRKIRSLMMILLRPKQVNKEDYVKFLIRYSLERETNSVDSFFESINLQNLKSLNFLQVFSSLKEKLNLSLPPEYLIIFCSAFDCLSTDTITKSSFAHHLMQNPQEKRLQNEDLIVSKCMLLKVIIEIYKTLEIKSTTYLFKIFDNHNSEKMTFIPFFASLKEIQLDVSEIKARELYEEGLKIQNEFSGLSKEGFVSVLTKFGIGHRSLKYFCVSDYKPGFHLKQLESISALLCHKKNKSTIPEGYHNIEQEYILN